ncbi:MAG: TolB family protein, partial [Nevskiales bacterium]
SNTAADNASSTPRISDNGLFVTFASSATNLNATGLARTVGGTDVYLADLSAAPTVTLRRIGTNADQPSTSADGSFIAFQSADPLLSQDTNGKKDIYVYDRINNTYELASGDGTGNNDSINPSLSGNGRRVAFFSTATNLIPPVTTSVGNFFVKDLDSGFTNRINADTLGNAGTITPAPGFVTISDDGRYVTFLSSATNLGAGNQGGTKVDVFAKALDPLDAALNGSNTGRIRKLFLGFNGTATNGDSQNVPRLTANGDRIVFNSDASNLVSPDAGGLRDVFLRANPLFVP